MFDHEHALELVERVSAGASVPSTDTQVVDANRARVLVSRAHGQTCSAEQVIDISCVAKLGFLPFLNEQFDRSLPHILVHLEVPLLKHPLEDTKQLPVVKIREEEGVHGIEAARKPCVLVPQHLEHRLLIA